MKEMGVRNSKNNLETHKFDRLFDETQCVYVNSRGLTKLCDHRPMNLISDVDFVNFPLDCIQDGDIVYVNPKTIFIVMMHVFHHKKKVFFLSNDCDINGPWNPQFNQTLTKLIESENCIRIFCQNQVFLPNHPKITPIPIGCDFHTMFVTQSIFPKTQENDLTKISKNTKPFWERKRKLYKTFFPTYTDRKDFISNANKHIYDEEQERIPRNRLWRNMTKYTFIPSPHGYGYDCHRTYEALILGCIVILKRTNYPFETIYQNLPVLFVEKWEDINQTLLDDTVENFKQKNWNYDKLTSQYWKDLILSSKKKYFQDKL